ncbi:hypothetical protein HY375_03245 [Candidatus Berkelbacteria bacterium]|nr:hypothetical protein [Candidatus Berkelbacteria bacterium]
MKKFGTSRWLLGSLLLMVLALPALAQGGGSPWEGCLNAARWAKIEVPLDANEDRLPYHYLVLPAEYEGDIMREGAVYILTMPGREPINLTLSNNFRRHGPTLRAQIPTLSDRGPVYLKVLGGTSHLGWTKFRLMEVYRSREPAIHDLRFVEEESG